MLYNNRVAFIYTCVTTMRLETNFVNRFPRTSLGIWKPKHLQQRSITVILDVLNNSTRKRETAKASECSSAFVISGQTSMPYKKTGMHFAALCIQNWTFQTCSIRNVQPITNAFRRFSADHIKRPVCIKIEGNGRPSARWLLCCCTIKYFVLRIYELRDTLTNFTYICKFYRSKQSEFH